MDGMQPPADWKQGLIARVKGILLQPRTEWGVIDNEISSIGGIYKGYVMALAAIAPVATLIHGVVFGYSLFGITYHPSIGGAIGTAVMSYLLSLVSVFALGWVIDMLAPSFGGAPNRLQAFKVAAYSATASWVAGIFNLLPGLGFLTVLGFYSLYLLYLGLPKLMKVPEDKAVPYTLVSIVAAAILFLIVGAASSAITSRFAGGSIGGGEGGTISIPGAGSVDVGKLEDASKRAEAAVKQVTANAASGTSGALAPEALKGLLPATIGSLARTEISASSAGAAGVGGAQADARYGSGANSIELKVTDMAALGALAGIGAALGVQSSKETADGYETIGKVDGRMTSEKWTNSSNSGSYSVVIADRFLVEADGSGTTMDALKGAVAAVGVDRLESLAAK
jgi:Yip1 domain